METRPRFKVSSERTENRGIDLATPGLVAQRVIHYSLPRLQPSDSGSSGLQSDPEEYLQPIVRVEVVCSSSTGKREACPC